MERLLRNAAIAALVCTVIAPFVGLALRLEGAVIVMLVIAVVAFFTVLFVMIIGSQEDHYPSDVAHSGSVQRWLERAPETGVEDSATDA